MSSVNVIGLGQLQAKLNGLSAEVLEEVDINVQDAAKLWEQLAKESAPRDSGFMANSILGSSTGFLTAEVVSPKFYSPYVEFGTGKYVFYGENISDELVAYAGQFRGKGKRKINHYPQQFFFVHSPEVEAFLIEHINQILNTEH